MKDISSYLIYKKKKQQQQRQNKQTTDIDDQTIMHLFSRAVREEYGRQGEKNIVPKFYKNGVIFVTIQNSIWAQELWTNRSLFVRVLNEKIGSKVVKNIKIAT
jgi:predicted nucleic acid-binding Zn ribbon protein